MKVLVKVPGKKAVMREIDGRLNEMQRLVGGGYIECIPLGHNVVLVCNEEGRPRNLPPNAEVCGYNIVGTMFFCTAKDKRLNELDGLGYGWLQTVAPHLWEGEDDG